MMFNVRGMASPHSVRYDLHALLSFLRITINKHGSLLALLSREENRNYNNYYLSRCVVIAYAVCFLDNFSFLTNDHRMSISARRWIERE